MNDANHSRWSDDLGAYLLGALEPREAEELARHLEGCASCREDLRWLEPAVHSLPESVERQEPPRQLRERLMGEVRSDAKESRELGSTRRRSRVWQLRPAIGFAVLALLVAGALGYTLGKGGGDGNGGGTNTVVRQSGGVTATMVREGDGGTLRLAGLRQPQPEKVLEAWVERDGRVEAVPALFVPDRQGEAETRIADMSGVATVMVTEEPRGGSEQPSSAPIVTMELS